MIVGNSNIQLKDVEGNASSYESLIKYSDSLIPHEWSHVQAIIDNQRYMCALLLRKSSKVTWDKKKPIIDRILSEVRIVGYTDELIDAKRIWSELSEVGVRRYYERSLLEDVKPKRKVN